MPIKWTWCNNADTLVHRPNEPTWWSKTLHVLMYVILITIHKILIQTFTIVTNTALSWYFRKSTHKTIKFLHRLNRSAFCNISPRNKSIESCLNPSLKLFFMYLMAEFHPSLSRPSLVLLPVLQSYRMLMLHGKKSTLSLPKYIQRIKEE